VGLDGAVDRGGTEDVELVDDVGDAKIVYGTVCMEGGTGSGGMAVGVEVG